MSASPTEPRVSFVTPVYNGARYLSECIESVLYQEYANWEYVILDNSSTDETAAIIDSYVRHEPRIRASRNDTLLPIMENWNAALAQVDPHSRYCKVVHADDRLFPRCTRMMVGVAERNPSVGLVGAYSLWGNRVACDGLPWPNECIDGRELSRLTLLGKVYPFLSPSSLLIRIDSKFHAGRFYPGPELHADVAACYDLLRTADFGFVHEVLTSIRRHDDSMTAKETGPFRKELLSNLALLKNYGPLFLDEEHYRARLSARWRSYLAFLARAALERRPREFWRFHLEGLRELGLPVSRIRLINAVLGLCFGNPAASLRRLLRARYGAGAQRS